MIARNENGRVTEVSATVSIDTKGAILGATLKSLPSVVPSQVARFKRLLSDLFPSEETLARRREAEGADAEEELCRRGCGQPAALNSECFACLREEWPS